MAEQYVYEVTRVHMQERGLLSAQDMEQLIAAENSKEFCKILNDKGWGAPELPANDPEAIFAYEWNKTWALITEMLGDLTPFHVFCVANDYHNLKAAIKLACSPNGERDVNAYFLPFGTVSADVIWKASEAFDFSSLPEALAETGREAYAALSQTRSGQSCDVVIDRAALIAIDGAGKKSESRLLKRYAELTVDTANIKAAVRCCLMKKDLPFIERVIAPVGTLDTKRLAAAAVSGLDAIFDCLKGSAYEGAIGELKKSVPAFERWCDNQLIALIRPQKNNYFSLEPIAAFILGRENEIKMARLILSAKVNKLSDEALRERLRDTYV